NMMIEYRWADDHRDRLPALAGELIRRQVAVIASAEGPAVAFAAKAYDRLVVAIIVVTGPDPLPAPRRRLPTPARAAIETNTGDERHGRKGEAAMVEPIKPRERKPIEAWCESLSERKVTRSDEGPSHEARSAETGTGNTRAEAAAREAAHPA